ncbi:MAG TPA: 3-hydroxyacyl-CoA dehydrogenase NAD-binding domain-containing protein [Dehalococcoidia bacterium]|nr:3-hydroxyacyl-CoA dehydrogenase NAD-binding domain-containing protein [Dehalococcoidia bacterium]
MSVDDIKLVGVMGGGVMGGGIAQTFIAHGFKTIVRDLNDDLIEKTRASMIEGRFGLKGAVDRGKMSQADFDATVARLSFTQDVNDLRDCDLIVEAVPENLDLKKSVFTELDGLVKPSAIFATNTSGFAIGDLNKAVARRDKFIGFHWFSPAFIMKPIEIIYAPETSQETLDTMVAVTQKLEKVAIRVKDAPGKYGFVGNRIYFAMVAEARKVLEEGIASAEDIDAVMQLGYNWPIGPLGMTRGARAGWQ